MSTDAQAIFLAGAFDEVTPLTKHYVKSNESRHDVWFPYIDALGGAYVGVGADQNYTLIARARSELVFILDIDERVTQTHTAYEVLIEASDSGDELVARFAPEATEETVALLEAALVDRPTSERVGVVRSYKRSRETLRRHLDRVRTRSRDGRPTSWLSDPQLYDWIRRLFQADRVRNLPGDLTGESTMRTIAAAAQQLGVPVRVLYLSNAEEYFKYFHGSYRENVRAMTGDERSVVLRTLYSDEWVHADSLWNYQVQPLLHFQAQLGDDGPRSRNAMLRMAHKSGEIRRETDVKGLSLVAMSPDA